MSYADHLGSLHPRAKADARVVSLVPSITELICDLGLASALVGRTGFCIHPREHVKRIPKIGGTKTVDLEAVRRLKPSHVIVNVDENRLETVEALRDFVPSIIVTHPQSPLDNPPLYRLLGGIFDREREAERLCAQFDSAWANARPCASDARVLYLIWRNPWMTISPDTYIARTLSAFGWHSWASSRPQRYPALELTESAGAVDRVLLSSEPYAFRKRHIDEVRGLLPGVPVDLIDGEMTSWYGSRAIAGLHYLAKFTAEKR